MLQPRKKLVKFSFNIMPHTLMKAFSSQQTHEVGNEKQSYEKVLVIYISQEAVKVTSLIHVRSIQTWGNVDCKEETHAALEREMEETPKNKLEC